MNAHIIVANLIVRMRSLSREKTTMFFTLAFPVILVLVFGAIFTRPEAMHFSLPVQDHDQSAASADLITSLSAESVFDTSVVPVDVDPVAYARQHKLTLMLVISGGFEQTLLRGDHPSGAQAGIELTYIHDPSSTSVENRILLLNAIIARVNQRHTGMPSLIRLTGRSILNRTYRFIEFFVPGIIALAVMTSSLSGALNMNAELRQKGILRKLATTPITSTDWLLSSILYQLVLASISTTVILLVSYAVFDVRLNVTAWLGAYIVLSVFVFVGLGMMLTPFAREAESAVAASNAILFPMMFLSGTFFPVEMMPAFLQKVATVLPLYYINEGLRASMIFDDNMAAARTAGITAVIAIVVFGCGAVVTRWNREA